MPNQEEILKLQKAYSDTFNSKEGQIVLEDLRKICFKDSLTINEQPNIMAFNEGHRAVLLHIERAMRMNLKTIPNRGV